MKMNIGRASFFILFFYAWRVWSVHSWRPFDVFRFHRISIRFSRQLWKNTSQMSRKTGGGVKTLLGLAARPTTNCRRSRPSDERFSFCTYIRLARNEAQFIPTLSPGSSSSRKERLAGVNRKTYILLICL